MTAFKQIIYSRRFANSDTKFYFVYTGHEEKNDYTFGTVIFHENALAYNLFRMNNILDIEFIHWDGTSRMLKPTKDSIKQDVKSMEADAVEICKKLNKSKKQNWNIVYRKHWQVRDRRRGDG